MSLQTAEGYWTPISYFLAQEWKLPTDYNKVNSEIDINKLTTRKMENELVEEWVMVSMLSSPAILGKMAPYYN